MCLKALFFQHARLIGGVAPGAGAAGFSPVGGGFLGCRGARFLFAGAAKIDDFALGLAHDPAQKSATFWDYALSARWAVWRPFAAAIVLAMIGDAGMARAIWP
jgi:hypothetical protein